MIGTSTNLVVTGMLETWAKENKEKIGADKVDIGLFDLGKYGVPVAFSGIVYVIIFSKYLLPGGNLQRAESIDIYKISATNLLSSILCVHGRA